MHGQPPADLFLLFCFTLRTWCESAYCGCVYGCVVGSVVSHHSWLSLSLSFTRALCLFFFSPGDMTMSLVPQFGSSFATFRPALSHSGSTRPLSVILPVPASPPYIRPPGSSSSSPTSKVPIWKVCSPLVSIYSVALFVLFLLHSFVNAQSLFSFHFHHLINSFITTLLCFLKMFIPTLLVGMHFFSVSLVSLTGFAIYRLQID